MKSWLETWFSKLFSEIRTVNAVSFQVRVKLPMDITEIRHAKRFDFDAAANPNGSTLNISFDFSFQDASMKLNPLAGQFWKLHSLPKGWSAPALDGEVLNPISVTVPEGNDEETLHVLLELMTCKLDECIPKKLAAAFKVNRNNDAPNSIHIQQALRVHWWIEFLF